MNWQKANYSGNLHQYVEETRKFLLELKSVSVKVPSEILSYIILGKLAGDPKHTQIVELLTLNKDIIEKPDQILSRLQEYANHCQTKDARPNSSAPASALVSSTSNEPYRIIYFCLHGKHNPKCLTHRKEECFAENPHLRPQRRDSKRKAPNPKPAAHISTAQALYTNANHQLSPGQLVVDCGATHHMFYSEDAFVSLSKDTTFAVTTEDSSSNLMAEGTGTVNLLNNQVLTLPNTCFVPKLNCNLVSLLKIFDKELTINRDGDSFTLTKQGKEILRGRTENNLMKVDYQLPTAYRTITRESPWHERLGHVGSSAIKSMGLPPSEEAFKICDLNNIHHLPSKSHFKPVNLPLDCIHIDLVGPFSPPSISGFRYFLTVVDQATSYKVVQLLKNKSDAFEQFTVAKKKMETQQDRSLKRLISDRGGEFLNSHFKQLSDECGFTHVFSPAYTPEPNAFAERANHTILEKARCMLNGSKLPNSYWAKAVSTATLLSNYIPTPSRHNHSPHAMKVVISKYVKFNESIFPDLKQREGDIAPLDISWNAVEGQEVVDEPHSPSECPLEPGYQEPVDEVQMTGSQDTIPTSNPDQVDEVLPVDETDSSPLPTVQSKPPGRIKVIGPCHPALICSNINQQNILSYPRQAGALLTSADEIPRTFKQALNCDAKEVWTAAINKELLSMENLKVWDVINLDPSYKLVGTTWVFKTKKNHLNEIIEHKARLCAQGFTQTAGINFDKTYSPTGRLNSLRTLIASSASNGLLFHQIDIKSAFLNAPLSETVYLSLPQGLNEDRRKFCLRLNKAIYGLKQAPLAWYERLKRWLTTVGFKACTLDPCIFHRRGNHPLWLYVHVDNIAIFGKEVEDFKTQIASEFEIKNIGMAYLMLGVKISQEGGVLTLDQQHYNESLLELYGMGKSRPVSTPLVPNSHLLPATLEEIAEFASLGVSYRSAIGSINYLSTATRPDLSFAVSTLSQFLEKPGIKHWKGFLQVLRYLNGSQDLGLVYGGKERCGNTAYSDADWGNFQVTRRSITGYLACFNQSLVIWKTRKQPTVSLSTAEAEYKSLCDLTLELLWLTQWCQESGISTCEDPIPVYEDNQGCINTENGDSNVNGRRMKHVDIQLHFVKEAIKSGRMRLEYTPTKDMLADFLTKSVPKPFLTHALDSLGVLSLGVRGGVKNQTN
ncbi:hypothetical protein O181_052098 [Austropuccinia psidii MF-1]|uniref:Integrase catalytic domain-containing protein n=1 Tax=Austropuccinia psidii MF-1 TaxID=1389203 RepID=A0A9Q3E4V7_9BASI|nr:hypothetical protein [Austropuccinia psidii MF-1]